MEIPNGSLDSVNSETASLEIMDNGKVYFFFYNSNINSIQIKRLNVAGNYWMNVQDLTLPAGVEYNTLRTYKEQNRIYIAINSNATSLNFSLWKMSLNQSTTQILDQEESSIGTFAKFDFTVDESSGILYSSALDNGSMVTIDQYDINNQQYISSTQTSEYCYSNPKIAIDKTNNEIYFLAHQSSEEYRIMKSQLSTNLVFDFFDGGATGGLTTSSMLEEGFGSSLELIEKSQSGPDAFFEHDGSFGETTHRLGINNSNQDIDFDSGNEFQNFAADGKGLNTYVVGNTPNTPRVRAYELQPDGSVVTVAAGNNPDLDPNYGEGFVFDAKNDQKRLATYFHNTVGGDGTGGGKFMMTNNPPSINSYDVKNACTGQLSTVINNFSFSDADGDPVTIIGTVSSSDANVIDPSSISIYTSPLRIVAEAGSTGPTELTFAYSDGLDTLTESVIVNAYNPTPVSFVSDVQICSNETGINLNDYVNESGGEFTISDITSEDGTLDLDLLDIVNYPYSTSMFYEYIDTNGCSSSANSALFVMEAPSVSLSTTNSTSCDDSDGEIIADVISHNGNYESYWNTGDQNTDNITDLSPGNYYYNVIDDSNCMTVANAGIESVDFAVDGTISNPSCHGGSDGEIALNITGGSGSYTILWSTGHGSINLQNLSAGNYQVVVTDSEGCQITRNFNLANPPKFNINYQVNSPDCNATNGSIVQFNSTGGTPPFSYSWNNGNQITQELNNIGQGLYRVKVTDLNGCKDSMVYVVNSIDAPSASPNSIVRTQCGESNGSIDINISPSSGEQITGIQWSTGDTTEDVSNLSPGDYECVITQSNGCDATYEWTVGNKKPPRPEICIVTVDTTTNSNLIVWEKMPNNPYDVEYYKIYRETVNAGQFQLIDTVHHSNISVFNDVVASPATRSWRYRISAVNNCGVESNRSQTHKTIHLVINDPGTGDINVSWDNYEGFIYNTYDLLRHTDADGWETIISDIPFNNIPDTIDTPPSTAGLDYMIEVTPPNGTCTATYGKAQDYNSSRSNKPRTEFNPGDGTGDPNNSLQKHENENFAVALYPNPSNGKFEVAVNHDVPNASLDLDVVDFNGKVVHSTQVNNGVNYIQLDNVQSGMYFVKIKDESNMETIRIVVQ
ncbi:MAG: T9SS type A sorting domain-containing protein [Brumimicrobium sp.]